MCKAGRHAVGAKPIYYFGGAYFKTHLKKIKALGARSLHHLADGPFKLFNAVLQRPSPPTLTRTLPGWMKEETLSDNPADSGTYPHFLISNHPVNQ
jgi:hypothetical protein